MYEVHYPLWTEGTNVFVLSYGGESPLLSTSKGSSPSASFHCYGAPSTTLPRQQFYDGASTITVHVDIMMLGQCMLPVIASDMANQILIPSLMECIASDYAEYACAIMEKAISR